MINEDEKKGKKLFSDHKYVMGTIGDIGQNLDHVSQFVENPVPPIQSQACTIAAWTLLILGVFAGQTENFAGDTGSNEILTSHRLVLFLANFPILQLTIYLLIFGWLKVGAKLSNPFGSDFQIDVDTVSRLDYEIWVASYLINQNSLLPDQTINLYV